MSMATVIVEATTEILMEIKTEVVEMGMREACLMLEMETAMAMETVSNQS